VESAIGLQQRSFGRDAGFDQAPERDQQIARQSEIPILRSVVLPRPKRR